MGLNEIAEEMLKNARSEAERIGAEGKGKASRILAEAEGRRKELLSKAKAEAEAVAANEKNEKIAAAHLEARRVVSRAKEGAINSSMAEMLQATAHARDKDYKELLKSLISEGVHEVGKDAVIRVNKSDHKLAHSLGHKLSDEPVDCIGGALITSPDGKTVFNNTFEARFELRKERLRTVVHKKLFGKGSE